MLVRSKSVNGSKHKVTWEPRPALVPKDTVFAAKTLCNGDETENSHVEDDENISDLILAKHFSRKREDLRQISVSIIGVRLFLKINFQVPTSVPHFARVPVHIPWPLLKGERRIQDILKRSGGINFFNQVVKLHPKVSAAAKASFFAASSVHEQFDHLRQFKNDNSELANRKDEAAEYFYVITYVPDLQWRRLFLFLLMFSSFSTVAA